MKKPAGFASVVMVLVTGACAMDEGDVELDPACVDDTKCDGESAQGFEVFQGVDSKWYFHLVSKNGHIVLRSQAYTTKQSATNGVESVRTNGVDPENFKVLQASSGEFYTNLYAANGQIIATSETYSRRFSALRAVDTSVELVSRAQRTRAAASGAKFQTITGADHQTYFHLRGKNGEVMAASEGYVNAASALDAIASVRENGKIATRYKLKQASDGQWFFHLVAANGEIISHSETYASKANAQRAADSMRALLASELVADPRPAQKPARSLTDKPELAQTVQALGEIASFGQSLGQFQMAEQAKKPAGITCEPGTAAEIGQAWDGFVQLVLTEGDRSARPDLTQAMIQSGRTQLDQLLGSDSYEICAREVTTTQTLTHETYMLSTQSDGPRLVLQLGYAQQ